MSQKALPLSRDEQYPPSDIVEWDKSNLNRQAKQMLKGSLTVGSLDKRRGKVDWDQK